MRSTLPLLVQTDFPALRRQALETLQVNLGYKCNQSCVHCHVTSLGLLYLNLYICPFLCISSWVG